MNIPLITLEDFESDKANCGTCTRKGGACLRNKSDKTIHNGYTFGIAGEPAGIIYKCLNYTGKFDTNQLNLF